MTGRYLLDEHLPVWWPRAIVKRHPSLTVWCIGDVGVPPRGTADPLILEWCEVNGFLLVTDNRASLPGHLADHLARGRHVAGILTIHRTIPIRVLADDLATLAGAGLPGDFDDQIRHLPL
ncbi:MAG TPA: hypothetical protein VMS17_15165 [Gemmataceae bacterium]|nr:hypothetical protein [Gemmataceae bacterium]